MPPEAEKTLENEEAEVDEDENDFLSSSVKKTKKSKPVKKEKVEAEEDESTLNCLIKKKKKKPINGSADARSKTSKVKKEEPKDEDSDEDEEPTTKKTPKKGEKEVKKKKKKLVKDEEMRVVLAEANGKKRERKVFDLPGQKRDPPEERDPLRIFYETLYKQSPDSDIAAFWMMESGLLPRNVAKKVYEKKQQQKLRSPIKAITSVKKTTKSVTVKRIKSSPASPLSKKNSGSKAAAKNPKKRKIDNSASESESDDDFSPAKSKSKKHKS